MMRWLNVAQWLLSIGTPAYVAGWFVARGSYGIAIALGLLALCGAFIAGFMVAWEAR